MDYRTGQILSGKPASKTIRWSFFASDNGPKATHPWEGDSGPWRGTYFTAMEGGIRAPFIIRWPGKVPVGRVDNEIVHIIVHIVDLFTTFARVGGAEVPKDRPIDGVDQLDFFLGKQENSNREGFPAYVADRLSAVKWRDWKAHLIWQENIYAPPLKLPLPKVINLLTDLKEERGVAVYNSWVIDPVMKIISEFEESLKKYPPIKVGTPDPYVPPNWSSGLLAGNLTFRCTGRTSLAQDTQETQDTLRGGRHGCFGYYFHSSRRQCVFRSSDS
jgi:hypothetical protein